MTSVSTLTDLEQETNSEPKNLYCWLQANNLSLHVTRTELLVIGSRQKILAENYDNISIKLQVDRAKSIGVVVSVSVSAVPFNETHYLRMSKKSDQKVNLKSVLTVYLCLWILTRQSYKTVH